MRPLWSSVRSMRALRTVPWLPSRDLPPRTTGVSKCMWLCVSMCRDGGHGGMWFRSSLLVALVVFLPHGLFGTDRI